MNFFCDSGGNIFHVDSEKVYQGSVNANKIYFIGAFPSFCEVTARFQLPNGTFTEPQLLTKVNLETLTEIQGKNGENFNVWYCLLNQIITQYYGAVSLQFSVYDSQTIKATANSSFEVLRGVPVEISEPSDFKTFADQVLAYIANVDTIVQNYNEKIGKYDEELSGAITDLEQARQEIENALEGLSGYVKNTDYNFVKQGIVNNPENLTDDEKTDACEWLGAVKKATNAPGGYFIYGTSYQSTDAKLFNSFFSATDYGYLAMYGPNGILRANAPSNEQDLTNKKYVDDAVPKIYTDINETTTTKKLNIYTDSNGYLHIDTE